MLEFKYDTQLLIEGNDLDEDKINDYITEHFQGDCLLAVGDPRGLDNGEKKSRARRYTGVCRGERRGNRISQASSRYALDRGARGKGTV